MMSTAGGPQSSSEASGGAVSLVSWFVFSLVFYGIPLILGYAGCAQIWQERAASLSEKAERQLEEVLSTFEMRGDTGEFMTRLLRQAEIRVFTGPDPRKRMRDLAHSVKKRFPGVFEFTFLDGEGRPVPSLCDFPGPRLILQRYFRAYASFLQGDTTAFDRESVIVQSFLGPFVPVGRKVHGTLVYASSRAHRRFVFLTPPRPQGMMIVHVTQTPDWRDLGIREEMRLFAARRPPVRLALVDINLPPEAGLRDLGVAPTVGRNLWAALDRSPLGKSRLGRSFFGRRLLKPSLYMVGRRRDIPDRHGATERLWFLGIAVSFWATLSWATWLIMSGRVPLSLSVRTKLILAFLYAAGIPLLVMGITSRTYLVERRQTLEHDLHNRMERSLIAFDGRFPDAVKRLEVGLLRRLFGFRVPTVADPASLSLELRRMRRFGQWDNARLFDVSGRVVFEDASLGLSSAGGGVFGMANKMAGRFLKGLDPEYREPLSNDKVHAMERTYAKASADLARIGEYQFSGAGFMNMIYSVLDTRGEPRFLMLILWGRNRLEWLHARRSLGVFSRQLEDSDLLAVNREKPHWSVPRTTRHAGLLAAFLPKVLSSSRSNRDRIEREGEVTLLTGIRGTKLTEYSLVAVSSDRPLRLDLDRIRWRFTTTGFVMAGLSVLIGLFLARMFLDPVRELTQGVAALSERRFDARVPVLAQDELGDLSHAFNEMMEGLADLEIARVVQENLFPRSPVEVHGWRVWGTCQPAAQVGGDYFDFFPIDGGKIGIILGDVSGHGVSAALVMAMAKAIIAHPRTGREPVGVMAALQHVLLRVLDRKKMMTCLYGVFDPAQRSFSFCNAGQCYPYLIRNGKAEQLKLSGLPLGTRSSRAYKPMTVPFETGDCLILYTDGLIEARRPNDVVLGYNGVADALGALIQGTPEETEKAIRTWHEAVVRPGPLEDDITVIALQAPAGGAV